VNASAARWRALTLCAVALCQPAAAAEPHLAARLADLGPRPVGSPAHDEAAALLLTALRDAGLEGVEARIAVVPTGAADPQVLAPNAASAGVEASPAPASMPAAGGSRRAAAGGSLTLRNLTGVLPGRGEGEILITAHYDTVPASPGAGDDASGCGAALGAVADLARTPLRRSIRLVLFDGEEAGLLGSKAWVEALSSAERDRILAVINVEGVGWGESAGPVVHTFPVRRAGERRLAPGWLVHAALRGADATSFRLSMVDPWISLAAQLLVRANRVRFSADSDSFLAAGIPALFVSDGSFVAFDPAYHRPTDTAERLDAARLARWSSALAGIVRRLDGLEGRPLDEDQYLVALGRVWLRRDLLWLCFGVWALLALASWRRRGEAESPGVRAAGFVFRTLFLLSAFATPVFAAALLVPAALLALRPPHRAGARRAAAAAGLLPALGLLGLTAVAVRRGFLGGWELGLPVTLLLTAALAAFVISLLRRPAPPLTA
jgi:hypothetical protein